MTAPPFTPAAERDLQAAAGWIARDNPTSAEALLRAALTAARYRLWPLRGFRYLLVYGTAADPPHVVRIVHTARDLPAALHDIGLDDL